MALREIIEPFVVGPGGRRMSPEQVAREREIAAALTKSGADYSPVGHWLQGAARLANAGVGAFQNWQLDQHEQAGRDNYAANSFLTAPGGAFASGSSTGGGPTGQASFAGAPGMGGASAGGGNSYRDAIASIESAGSGDYNAVGPTHDTLGRALGRYQVMEANIGPWSREALGREITPEEFMASPELQDAIFDHRFGSYVDQYGPQGAAQAWFAGPGGVGKMDRRDVLGTSVSAYTDKFTNAIGGAGAQPAPVQVASLAPSIGMPQPMGAQLPQIGPAGGPQMAVAPQAPNPTRDIAQALVPPPGAPAQGGMSPTMEQIAQVLGDPWAPREHKEIAQLLMGQQLQQQAQASDPLRQLQIERAQMENAALRSPAAPKPIEVGGVLLDSTTFQPIFDSRAPAAAPQPINVGGVLVDPVTFQPVFDSRQPSENGFTLSPGQQRFDATGKPIASAGPEQPDPNKAPTVQKVLLEDGSEMAVQWDGGSQSWVPINAPAGGGTLTPPKGMTESQSKLTLFQSLQTETQPVLLDLESQFNPGNLQDAAARSTPIAGNFFQSEQGQIYNSAATAWAEGALRIATGAAATPEEMERTKRAYFAQPGDTPNTIAFKAQMREMYNRAINNSLGQPGEGSLPLPSAFAQQAGGGSQQNGAGTTSSGLKWSIVP